MEGADTLGGVSRHRRRRRILLSLLAALVVLLALGAGGVWYGVNHYAGQVQRIPNALPTVPASQRPVKPAAEAGAVTFLLIGTDSESTVPTTGNAAKAPLWVYGAQQSDTIMLLHLTADRKNAYVISIPRDTWVPIPGHGSAKIDAAFSWGGPPLLIQTVEQLTNVRIDHFGAIDWSGFKALTDAVGGVTITIPSNSYDSEQNIHWTAGTYTMNGTTALAYVRQRYGLPNGDLDRIARQQNFLRALMSKTSGEFSLTNPFGVNRVLDAVTKAVSVDDQLSNGDLRDLALSLVGLKAGNVTFASAPLGQFITVDGQDALTLDPSRTPQLWQAISHDSLPSWIHQYGGDTVLPAAVQ
ncbi:LCP family protein [Streptacidiphilus sp. EB129]|uniref:LCP family protein n=1 Tax=Streptacidiphilus sp. EB129 TaxID=3156262 RepID=UPI003515FE3A